MENLDPAALFPQVSIEERFIYEREPLIAGLTSGLAKAARADRSLTDRDLIAALTVLARAFERLVSSGLHYAESVPSGAQQLVVNQLQQMLTEFRELEQKHLGHTTLRDSDTLKAFVFLLRTAEGRTSGRPRSRAFIDFLFEQFPQKESLIAGPQEAGSRLIVP